MAGEFISLATFAAVTGALLLACLLPVRRAACKLSAPAAAPDQRQPDQQQPEQVLPRATYEEAMSQPEEPFAKSWLAGALALVLLPLLVALLLLAARDIEMGFSALLALAPFCCLLLIALFWGARQASNAIPAGRRIEQAGNSEHAPWTSAHE